MSTKCEKCGYPLIDDENGEMFCKSCNTTYVIIEKEDYEDVKEEAWCYRDLNR